MDTSSYHQIVYAEDHLHVRFLIAFLNEYVYSKRLIGRQRSWHRVILNESALFMASFPNGEDL